jgi:hypothetical protein
MLRENLGGELGAGRPPLGRGNGCGGLRLLRTAAAAGAALLSLRLAALDLYVAPGGNDSNAGTPAAPLATPTGARNAIRSLKALSGLPSGGINVWLESGYYNQAATFFLNAQDSGTPASPITYSAAPGAQAFITGAQPLNPAWFSLVTSASPVWSRLDPSAQGNVYQVNLGANGITDYGTLKAGGYGKYTVAALELFYNSQPMTLARWPNAGQPMAQTVASSSNTQFTYSGTRPQRWTSAQDIWMHGLWNCPWADYHVDVASINTATSTVNLVSGPPLFGIGASQFYYAYNLLEEIDEPGEYYVDRVSGILYFWPPGPLTGANLQVSMLEPSLVELDAASYVSLQNLTFEATRGPLMQIFSGNNCSIVGCLFRNGGEYAAEITGTGNGLDQCEIVDCGEDGVLLGGGVRASLTAGNDYVTNCRIHRTSRINWTYHPAVNFFDGCGDVATNNFIDQLPHSAVMLCGNNHVIEYNEISRVCQLTSDSGAIYSGRDWGYRGNLINYNFIHHLENSLEGPDTHGVYLDDLMSSAQVVGNVFYALGGAGIFSGGGRDNNMSNNIIAECAMAHYDGDYARNSVNNISGNSFNLLQRLAAEGIEYQTGIWASSYPTCAAIPNSWTQVQLGLWRNPQGCTFSNNAGWSNTTWTYETDVSGTGVFEVYASFTNNNPSQTPLFTEATSWDRTLRPASLTASVTGFVPIPFSSIGPSSPSTSSATLAPPAQRLQSLAVTETEVDVQWADDGNLRMQQPTGFTLQEEVGTSGTWTTIQSFGPDVNYAAVTGLSPDAGYSFRVLATNAAGTTYSNVLATTTLMAPLVPGTPVRFEAESPLEVIVSLNKNAPVGILSPTLVSGKAVSLFDVGDTIQITFTVPASGTYQIGARVRSGDSNVPVGTSYWPDGYAFTLDGASITLTGDPTTVSALSQSLGPTYWGTMFSGNVTLTAGSHSLDIIAKRSWAGADYMQVAPMVEP